MHANRQMLRNVRIFTALLLCFLVSPGHATLVQIDFSSLSPGDVLTNQLPGVTFSLLGSPPIAGPLVVNPGSTQTAGSAGNLITPTDQGSPVCCVGPFYDIAIDFASPIDFFSILALDAEANETYTLSAYLGGVPIAAQFSMSIVGSFSIPTSGGPIRQNALGAMGGLLLFDRVVIDLTNSEGPEVWDDVSFNVVSVTVPEPAPLFLLSFGILALVFARREARSLS